MTAGNLLSAVVFFQLTTLADNNDAEGFKKSGESAALTPFFSASFSDSLLAI